MITDLPEERLLLLYRRMLLARRFEEGVLILGAAGRLPGHYHVYIGQEAEALGVEAVRGSQDLLFLNHRNHGYLCFAGADVRLFMAELLGRATGYNGGKGGSFHTCVPELGIPHVTSIVGGLVPIAVGAGLGLKLRGVPAISFAIFGDGYINEGACQEAFNLAALKKPQTILFCENNNYDASRRGSPTQSAPQLTGLAEANGIPAEAVDGTDSGALYQALTRARNHTLGGNGPYFIEARTKRWPGNRQAQNPTLATGETDMTMAWDPIVPGRLKEWEEWYVYADPVLRITRELLESAKITREQVLRMDEEVRDEVRQAMDFGRDSPLPDPSKALDGVFA